MLWRACVIEIHGSRLVHNVHLDNVILLLCDLPQLLLALDISKILILDLGYRLCGRDSVEGFGYFTKWLEHSRCVSLIVLFVADRAVSHAS